MGEEREVHETSFFDQGEIYDPVTKETKLGRMYEQIFPACFAEYDRDTKTVTYLPKKDLGEFILAPIVSEAVTKNLVLLPNEATEYGSEEELLAEIRAYIHKYLDISPEMETFACYYALLSWVYDRFGTIPYLRARGDTGSGKSRFLNTIGSICYKPILAAGAATSAPVFRLLGTWKGTLVIDEADFAKSDTTQDIVKILNQGFEKNAPVVRCDKENPKEIEVHEVFGPKVIGTRYGFQDKALESRCLTEKMKETRRKDLPSNLGVHFWDEATKLRSKLLMFRFRTYDSIDAEADGMDLNFLEPRLRQSSKAFSQLIKGKPELEKGFVEFMTAYQKELIEERADSLEGVIVNAIYLLESEGTLVYTSGGIAAKINEDRPEKDHLKPRKVSPILKSLGLTTEMARDGNKVMRKVVLPDELRPVIFSRYVVDYDPAKCNQCNDCNAIYGEAPSGYTPLPSKDKTLVTTVTIVTDDTRSHYTSLQSLHQLQDFLSKEGRDVTGATLEEILVGVVADEEEIKKILAQMVHDGTALEGPGGRYVIRKR